MPVSLSIKNVPDQVAERLRMRAERHHRSIQGELLAILEAAVDEGSLTVEEAHARIKAMGLRTKADSTRIVRELRDAR